MGFTLRAPAKINLYLKVRHRRPDGFHNILSLMQMIDLCDTLTFREEGVSVRLEVKQGDVPPDGSNLVLKAARMLQKQMTHACIRRGVVITLDKKIPISAGLGGGSSDAAATLRGLNALWSLGLSSRRLAEIGGRVGSDVPFFFYGPAAWVSGRGERVRKVSLPVLGYIVLVYAGEPVSTASVYHQMDEMARLPDAEGLAEGSVEGQTVLPPLETILRCPENDLERVTLAMQPSLRTLKRELSELGGEGPLMSGSGPTVFARFATLDQANKAAGALRARGYKDVWVSNLLRRVPHGFGAPRRFFSDSI